ncbi:MAG TPA: hypothetical protein VL461_02775 [Dictyobacter sp.]|jgi:predicted transcriptional regulator|nr:hypothetical protein [Dictyobacter sp.]
MQGRKPTLRTLCLEHKITIFELEKESNINYVSIWSVFIGLDTTLDTVEQLLHALNHLKGTTYTVNDIQFSVANGRMYV